MSNSANSRVIFSLGVVALSLSADAFANPICNTLEDCREMQADLEVQIRDLEAPLNPYFRNEEGEIAELNFNHAARSCEERGATLPSIKRIAMALNPKGVHFTRPNSRGAQYQTIYKVDGTVEFYYDHRTYVRDPRAEEGLKLRRHEEFHIDVVSSNIVNYSTEWIYDFRNNNVYVFDAVTGVVDMKSLFTTEGGGLFTVPARFAVRCATSR